MHKNTQLSEERNSSTYTGPYLRDTALSESSILPLLSFLWLMNGYGESTVCSLIQPDG